MVAVGAARSGGEYFATPEPGPQRRYEALRAYLLDGEPAAAVAQRFGYTTTGLYSAVRDFRAVVAGPGTSSPTPGPARRPRRARTPPAPGSSSCARRATRSTRSPHGAGPRRRRVEPHRDQRSDHRGRAAADLAPARTPPAAGPAAKTCPGPVPWPTRTTPTSPASSPAATRPGWPGCCSPCPTCSPWTCPAWSTRPATPAPATSPRSPTCCPCWRSSSPRPAGSPTSTTWPPTRRRPVRRPDRAAQDDRADHLLLPARPRPAGRVPDRAGQGRHPPRAWPPARCVNLDFHAVMHWGQDAGAGEALRALTVPAHPQRADLLRRGRRQPRPALRQRRPREGHPGKGGARLRRPLEDRHRPRPGPARHGLQGHHPGPARRP